MTRTSAALLAAAFLLAGCGGSAPMSSAGPDTEAVKNALVARLQGKSLSYRWIVCVADRHSFRSQPIVRCNVNFGEPHIEVYCSVLQDGRLETNHELPAIPCGRDDAGYTAPTATS